VRRPRSVRRSGARAASDSSVGGLDLGLECVPEAVLEAARVEAELAGRLVGGGPVRDPGGRVDDLAQVRLAEEATERGGDPRGRFGEGGPGGPRAAEPRRDRECVAEPVARAGEHVGSRNSASIERGDDADREVVNVDESQAKINEGEVRELAGVGEVELVTHL